MAMIQCHHHVQRMAKMLGMQAQQIVDVHRDLGDEGLKDVLLTAHQNGADPNITQQVAQHLYQNGRPDLAQIHHEFLEDWSGE